MSKSMSEDGVYSTFVRTEDGKVYDLGKREYPPVHHHPGEAPCPECFVVNAYTEKIEELPNAFPEK
jgi:hypothetical protein